MAARALARPAGKVSEVFQNAAEQQGAYDLLESNHVALEPVQDAMGRAACRLGGAERFIYVAVDGSSLTLKERDCRKGFGRIGPGATRSSRGLKVINALAISPRGIPLGMCAQTWWARAEGSPGVNKARRNRRLRASEKETQHWLDTIERTRMLGDESGTRLRFVLDREADNRSMLLKLHATAHEFIVRSSWNRLIEATGADEQYLRQRIAREAPGGAYELDVPAGWKRAPRRARIVVRWTRVVLRLRDQWRKSEKRLAVCVVWAREQGTTPAGEKPLDWMLLTNTSVASMAAALEVVYGYTQRWRVEDFHRTWKTGACNVESTQLRSAAAVALWATVLAAVAAQVERLKHLARTTPDEPASVVLTKHEIEALLVLKRRLKKRNETIPDRMPTIAEATLWIAQMGGYTGKSSGGPPGATTIRRGLDRLAPAAEVLSALEDQRG